MVQIINSRSARIFQGPPPGPRALYQPPTQPVTPALFQKLRETQKENAELKVELGQCRHRLAQTEEMLSNILDRVGVGDKPPPKLEFAQLAALVADANGMTTDMLRSPCRARPLAIPRMMFCYLARILFPQYSLPMIGRYLRRDHTSIMHAIAVTKRRLQEAEPRTVHAFTATLQRLPEEHQAVIAKLSGLATQEACRGAPVSRTVAARAAGSGGEGRFGQTEG